MDNQRYPRPYLMIDENSKKQINHPEMKDKYRQIHINIRNLMKK